MNKKDIEMPRIGCTRCIASEFCRCTSTLIVRQGELDTPHWLRSARNFAASLDVSPQRWHEVVINWNRDYPGRFVQFKAKHKLRDPHYLGVMLRMEVFERPYIDEWFEDFLCTAVPEHVTPYVTVKASARAKVALTLLRARYPVAASTWPLEIANTNRPPYGR